MAYLIDMTRPSLDILVDLINQENPGSLLKPEWVTVASGYPKEVSYQGKDTHTVLSAKKGSPLFGNTPFYYNRIRLDLHTSGKQLAIPNDPKYKTSFDILPLVLQQLGIRLETYDVIFENIIADAQGKYTLRIAAKSLMYKGFIESAAPGASVFTGASTKYLDGFYKP